MRRIFFLLHLLIARLSTETAAFLLFGFYVASLFVSGCIQTFTSASRCCHCRQPLRHSLSPVTAFHSLTSASPAIALPFSRLLHLPVAVVGFLVVLLFRRRPLYRRWPLIRRSLQLVVTIVGLPLVFTSASHSQCRLVVVLRIPQELQASEVPKTNFLLLCSLQ